MDEINQAKRELWLRQLERMRAMQYAYHQKFFSGLLIWLVIFLALLLVVPHPFAPALVPWLVVTAGLQSCFFLHFCDFARIHAAALERQLNAQLASRVLLAGSLEEDFFYPTQSPRLGGVIFKAPWRFFSIFTLHWCLVWAALALGGWMLSWEALGSAAPACLAAWALWILAHLLYLGWHFGTSAGNSHLATRLQKELNGPMRSDEVKTDARAV